MIAVSGYSNGSIMPTPIPFIGLAALFLPWLHLLVVITAAVLALLAYWQTRAGAVAWLAAGLTVLAATALVSRAFAWVLWYLGAQSAFGSAAQLRQLVFGMSALNELLATAGVVLLLVGVLRLKRHLRAAV
jgi:hypothetical protein